MKKALPLVILTVAVFYIAKESLMYVLLQSIDMSSSIGTFLLLLFAFIVACVGILALSSLSFTKYINKKSGFIETIKALMRVGLLLLGFVLASGVIMGIVASLLQGITKSAQTAKGITDWVILAFSVLAIPIFIHIFLTAGIYSTKPKESLSTLKGNYLLLLTVTIASFLLGRILDSFLSIYILNLSIMFVFTVCIVLFVFWQYLKPKGNEYE